MAHTEFSPGKKTFTRGTLVGDMRVPTQSPDGHIVSSRYSCNSRTVKHAQVVATSLPYPGTPAHTRPIQIHAPIPAHTHPPATRVCLSLTSLPCFYEFLPFSRVSSFPPVAYPYILWCFRLYFQVYFSQVLSLFYQPFTRKPFTGFVLVVFFIRVPRFLNILVMIFNHSCNDF